MHLILGTATIYYKSELKEYLW